MRSMKKVRSEKHIGGPVSLEKENRQVYPQKAEYQGIIDKLRVPFFLSFRTQSNPHKATSSYPSLLPRKESELQKVTFSDLILLLYYHFIQQISNYPKSFNITFLLLF
jgi:hypothetical protein